MNIPYINLSVSEKEYAECIEPLIRKVFMKGDFIGGDAVKEFERAFSEYCGTQYAVAVASGTDALFLTLKSFGVGNGDEVITVGNSFIATTNAISNTGAVPIVCDIRQDLLIDVSKIEELITERTKAILPVHLTGLICDMDEINRIADKYNLIVIEDAAQSAGSEYKGIKAGNLSHAGCFSMHPLKNLGGIGDGGIVTTNHKELADTIRMYREHGMTDRNNQTLIGYVSRLDTINAAILCQRLLKLDNIIADRRVKAALFKKYLNGLKTVVCYNEPGYKLHSYHVFVVIVEKRKELISHLTEAGIETKIHYPVPAVNQPCFNGKVENCVKTFELSEKILTLPLANVTEEDIQYICSKIREFYAN